MGGFPPQKKAHSFFFDGGKLGCSENRLYILGSETDAPSIHCVSFIIPSDVVLDLNHAFHNRFHCK